MRAAASSIASGRPSRRTQISATAGAFSFVTSNPGFTARARSMNSATASYCESCDSEGRLAGSGRPSGGTGYSCSPDTCSALRLLVRTARFGQAARSSLTDAPAPSTCSKLSRTSSAASRPEVVDDALDRRPAATLGEAERLRDRRRHELRIGDRRELDEPDAVGVVAQRSGPATSRLSRVLPVPPGPVRVSSR